MSHRYRVDEATFEDGERVPLLVDRESGVPLLRPNLWALNVRRATGKAVNTIRQDLRCLAFLYAWADQNDIDLESRFQSLDFLTISEVDALTTAARKPLSDINTVGISSQGARTQRASRVMRLPRAAEQVRTASMAARLRTARDYLDWLAADHIGRRSLRDPSYTAAESARTRLCNALNERVPDKKGRSMTGAREGISAELVDAIIQVLIPGSENNPWTSEFVQVRNQAMFHLQMSVGIRAGELAKLKIRELDARENTVLITRSPDDQEEVRKRAPQAKTRDRKLTVEPGVVRMITEYTLKYRRSLRGARQHPFLWVANRTGEPASIDVIFQLYRDLRRAIPDLPEDFSSHVARHTWNDRFCELCDAHGIEPEEEQSMRAYQMGWSPTSGMAETYTKRHVRIKTDKYSLDLQKRIITGGDKPNEPKDEI